jgi:elongation factor Ts
MFGLIRRAKPLSCTLVSAMPYSSVPSLSVQEIARLRKDSGASIQKCKEALEQSNGSMKDAIELLRKRGQTINARGSDASKFGGSRVSASVTPDSRRAVLSRTTSLTDFASESELFVKFSESVNRSICAGDISEKSRIPSDLKLSVPISDQIHGQNLDQVVSELSSILSEPVTLSDVDVVEGDHVSIYVHGKSSYSTHVGSMGVACSLRFKSYVSLNPEQTRFLSCLSDRIARQILATGPRYISPGDIPQMVIDKERDLLSSRVTNKAALDKAFAGHMKKFFSETCLLNMEWIIPFPDLDIPEGASVADVMRVSFTKIGVDQDGIKIDRFVIRK